MENGVTLTVDGRRITVEKGKTVLQASIEHGIKVPYYCYHPGLGIDGSCRVCLVKIEKMPKLQTACSTPAAEGMPGAVRRAYLKGLGEARGCEPPATPSHVRAGTPPVQERRGPHFPIRKTPASSSTAPAT